MSNGYLVAAAADLAAAHEIAEGFGLDVIDASSVHDHQTTSAALGRAANVGVLLSAESARDAAFLALLGSMATQLERAQLILVGGDPRAAFPALPEAWPAMSLEEARSRSSELLRRRQAETPADDALRAETQAPHPSPSPQPAEPAPAAQASEPAIEPPPSLSAPEPLPEPPPSHAAPTIEESPPALSAPELPPLARAPAEDAPSWQEAPLRSPAPAGAAADATAFAPGKLRRGTPELVRIVVHQPKDLNAVIKAAKKIDPRAEPGPQGVNLGNVPFGASVGVALEVRGGACDGSVQRRTWIGDAVDFNFTVEADASVKQAVLLARVFVGDAQIGVLAFTRKVVGPSPTPHGPGDRARLRRHKRVFLSYSSEDRKIVSAIATAYAMAGVEHFWDRASLKAGEEWSPRLRREIERADLFHLCWSKAAAKSEWVHKEAEHALTRRRKHSGKPEITVQMLDGPPWAPHPPSLDAINFDDFVRAAVVGYARGDGD